MTAFKKEGLKIKTFDQFIATQKLKDLVKSPYDLTAEEALTPERVEHFVAEACGWRLLYGTERVTEEVMEALAALAKECAVLDKIEQMQAGEVINCIKGYPSENRQALHTATRDFFDHPNKEEAAVKAAKEAKEECEKLKLFSSKIDQEGRFKDLVMIGIGGSYLGPCANYLALEQMKKPGRQVYFVSNVDPDNAARVLRDIDLEKTLFLVVSKSGGTLETLANEAFFKERLIQAGLDPSRQFVAITGKGSPIDDPENYLASFYIWDWIGGRFSSTSMVGGVLLSFAFGFDVYWEFLRGASAMDKAALSGNINKNLPLLAALLGIWNHNFLDCRTYALIPYSEALARFPAHIQQVEMESNGKRVDRQGHAVNFQTGSIVWGEPGTSAQHSFYQLIHQGTEIIPVEFVGFQQNRFTEESTFQGTTLQQKLNANLFAQAIALATGKQSDNPNQQFPGNRPSHMLLAERLTPYALGSLLSFFENKIAFQGFIWDINSFDQEGVQLGKVLAKKVLACFDKEAEPYPLGNAFLKQLKRF